MIFSKSFVDFYFAESYFSQREDGEIVFDDL